MSLALPSDEVATDFREALQDLRVNSRIEISNLTIIAKENTEHAQAISRELENHIRTTKPEWKLPALYVLDSIVKNVGTPYTVYLGRELFRTFMDAYSVMGSDTRKHMEGLLKTWKVPVAESMDTRPVFPNDVTRDIENALIKYRTVAIQQQQQARNSRFPLNPMQAQARHVQPEPWRNTPTPPQGYPHAAINDPRVRQATPQHPWAQNMPGPSASVPMHLQSQPNGIAPPAISQQKLASDISVLIESTKKEMFSDFTNPEKLKKFQALVALEKMVTASQPTPDQLKAISDTISQLSPTPVQTPTLHPAQVLPHRQPSSLPPTPQPPIPPQFLQAPTPVQQPYVTPPQPFPQPPSVLPGSGPPADLSQILRSYTPTAQPGQPPPQQQMQPAVSQPGQPPASSNAPLAQFMASLTQGATPATNGTPATPSLPQAPSQPPQQQSAPSWLMDILKSTPVNQPNPTPSNALSGLPLGILDPANRAAIPSARAGNDVELNTTSITKVDRPHLIKQLYEQQPNQCMTCGRRFPSTPQGKQMKAKHLDWHFKVKDPDVAKRGVHRSWYISERDWIDFREQDDASLKESGDKADGSEQAGKRKKDPRDRYVLVPAQGPLVNIPCPICQEKFDPQWSVEANDFVWMDAIKINGKVYHATCWEEMNGGAAVRSGTPDSVLGKRKNEQDNDGEAMKKMR